MFENIGNFFKKMMKNDQKELLVDTTSKDAAKERLHIVLMQDRANVSADFLELMKQEIIDVIKKYIVIDEEQIDVRLTNQENDDGTTGAPSLYANIPILNIRNDIKGEVLGQEDKNKISDEESSNIITEITDENNVEKENLPEKEKESKSNEKNIEEVDKGKVKDKNTDDSEEDDDDVTFDDLLKAAEEEEKQKKIADKEKTTPKKKSASMGRPKKTTTKKTSKTKKSTAKKS